MSKDTIDLHLIRVLCTLVETRNATQAAYRLATGNSAITYALNKLREHYKDPLMVREKKGLQPTVLALELFTLFRPALEQIERATQYVSQPPQAMRQQTLFIRTNSLIEVWLMTQLMERDPQGEQPACNFVYSAMSADDRLEALRGRQVNIDIGLPLEVDRSLLSFPLRISGLSAVCRPGHPRIGDSISLEQLQQEKIFTWYHPQETIVPERLTTQFEGAHTMSRPYHSASLVNLLLLTARTDGVCLLPRSFVSFIVSLFGLKAVECPFVPHIRYDIRAYIHHTQRNNPAVLAILDLLPLANAVSSRSPSVTDS